MPGQLRYELIGDASSFANARQEVSEGAEKMEASLSELQQQLASTERGQVAFNESAQRYVNAAGDFISASEGQQRALKELNSIGIKTEEEYQSQIQRLERLQNTVEEGSVEYTQLQNRLEQVQSEFQRLSGSQERVQNELRSTAAAQEQVGQAGVTMRSSVSASAKNLVLNLCKLPKMQNLALLG